MDVPVLSDQLATRAVTMSERLRSDDARRSMQIDSVLACSGCGRKTLGLSRDTVTVARRTTGTGVIARLHRATC